MLNKYLNTQTKKTFVVALSILIVSFIIVAYPYLRKINPQVSFTTSRAVNFPSIFVIPQETLPDPPANTAWQLSFSDEFSGATLDGTKWNKNGDYLRSGRWFLKNNANLNGLGQLVLRRVFDSNLNAYSTAIIDTDGKYTPKFGYIGAKIKYDTGGFWMMTGDTVVVNNSGQDGSEIDIAEKWDPTFINHALHWDGYGTDHKFANNFDFNVNTSSYQEVGLDWTSNLYKFYVDGINRWQSTAGGVSQQPGYIILGGPHYNAPKISSDLTYVDYVHAYTPKARTTFTYSIGSPGIHTNYPDSGNELNDGTLASTAFTDPKWIGVIGQSPAYFDIALNSSINIGQITLHTMKQTGPGIYLPDKIELWCSGSKNKEWIVAEPAEDGLYQIILNGLPATCPQSSLRVTNWWWTFLSEIVIQPYKADTNPPTVMITSPSNGATINPPSYSTVSGKVNVQATAADDKGVAWVQFKIDGVNFGTQITSAPYAAILDTTKYTNGFHSLSAEASDTSGNKTSFLNLIFTIANNSSNPAPVAYWKLDEASGNRLDSVGSNTLTSNNGVTQAVGKISNASQFAAASSQYLSITDNPSLSTGNIDFTITAWVKLSSTAASRTVAAKRDGSGSREWNLVYNQATGKFRFATFDATGNANAGAVEDTTAISAGTWYYVVAWRDSAADRLYIQVNNNAATFALENLSGTNPVDSTSSFRIGGIDNPVSTFMDGIVDEVGFWKKILSAQERTDLYSNGYRP